MQGLTHQRSEAAAVFFATHLARGLFMATVFISQAAWAQDTSVVVSAGNFIRAESDMYFGKKVQEGGLGRLVHERLPTSVDRQTVVRMNRDTLYSSGVFDLDAAPVTITLPDVGKRFMSLQVISQDHYTTEVVYAPGAHRYDRAAVGSRYAYVIVRTLVNAQDPQDVAAAQHSQDAIQIEQASRGSFESPKWDLGSQKKVRDLLESLGALGVGPEKFGSRDKVNPVDHLIGTAIGWGGNPRYAADYISAHPKANDGKTVHTLTLRDVPVDGFWSISVYNNKGFFQKNLLGAYSFNNQTAKPNADGSFTFQFGGCRKETPNCLPITTGWSYTTRLYRPRQEVIDGSWTVPEALPLY